MASLYVEPLFVRFVPPAAMTVGRTDGPPMLPYAASPDEARYVMPGELK